VQRNFGAQSSLDDVCPGNKRLSRTTSAVEIG